MKAKTKFISYARNDSNKQTGIFISMKHRKHAFINKPKIWYPSLITAWMDHNNMGKKQICEYCYTETKYFNRSKELTLLCRLFVK